MCFKPVYNVTPTWFCVCYITQLYVTQERCEVHSTPSLRVVHYYEYVFDVILLIHLYHILCGKVLHYTGTFPDINWYNLRNHVYSLHMAYLDCVYCYFITNFIWCL